MSESIKQKTINGVVWSSIERFSVQGIQFVVMLIMAQILTPEDYGMVGMLAIFMAIAQSLIDSGFSNALIRKTNRTETDFSTIFYFNIVVGFVLYLVLFLCAPAIARFYQIPQLEILTRVIAVVIFFNSLTIVQRAILTIQVDFKTQAIASLGGVGMSGVVGIVMTYAGFGVWSIVFQMVVYSLVTMLMLWILTSWWPRRVFSKSSFKELFSFGSKLLISGIIDVIYKNIYTIVIGKKYSAMEVGYYNRADQFAQFPSSNLTGILQRVTFPVLCNVQNDLPTLVLYSRKFLRIFGYLIFPLMIGLAVLAKPLIQVLLNENWLFVATLLPIISIAYMFHPIHAINLCILQVKGRSDLFLRQEIIKKTIGVGILLITFRMGLIYMCLGLVVSSLIALIINSYYTKKLILFGFGKQILDLLPSLLYSITMGMVMYAVTRCVASPLFKLIVGIPTGILYYCVISILFKSMEFREIRMILTHKNKKRHGR